MKITREQMLALKPCDMKAFDAPPKDSLRAQFMRDGEMHLPDKWTVDMLAQGKTDIMLFAWKKGLLKGVSQADLIAVIKHKGALAREAKLAAKLDEAP